MYKSKFFTIDRNELIKLVNESTSYSQIFDKLNMCKKDTQYKRLKLRISQENIDTSHFLKWKKIPTEKMSYIL